MPVVVDPAATTPIDIRLRDPARIVLHVAGSEASECREQLRVSVTEEPECAYGHFLDGDYLVGDGRLDRSGRITLSPLQAAEVTLALRLKVSSHSSALLISKRIRAASGLQKITWRLPKLHTVRVHWRGKNTTELRLWRDVKGEFAQAWEKSAAPGTAAKIRFVPAGKYWLSYSDGPDRSGGRVSIEVPAQLQVDLPR